MSNSCRFHFATRALEKRGHEFVNRLAGIFRTKCSSRQSNAHGAPGHPFQRCQLDGLPCFPGAAMNQFGLVQTVDCLGQCVIVTVATSTRRGLDARFGQSLAIANANVLRASVGVMYQRSIAAWAPRIKCLFKCIQNEVCSHRRTDAPTDNPSRERVCRTCEVRPAAADSEGWRSIAGAGPRIDIGRLSQRQKQPARCGRGGCATSTYSGSTHPGAVGERAFSHRNVQGAGWRME